jgi:hypothetical protein
MCIDVKKSPQNLMWANNDVTPQHHRATNNNNDEKKRKTEEWQQSQLRINVERTLCMS